MTISIKPTASGSTIEQDGSTILTVDGSGNVTVANSLITTGNVGIGTVTPYGSATLSVSGSVTATSGWTGTNSSAGALAGIPQVVTIERGGVGTTLTGFAFGNGSTGNGMRMPYAGKITVATLHCTDLNGTFSAYIEKNGTANAAYALSATAATADAGQTQTFVFTFAAGDSINWQQQAVPTANTTAVISFWIIFD
jgi:hypothetical protein